MADREPGSEPRSEPLPACLLLHGLGGGPFEFGSIIDSLVAEGHEVKAPVLPGHEGPGKVMPASCWQDWAAVSEQAFDDLAASGRPVVVIGFSTGGTLGLRLAGTRPVARLGLLAPFLAIRYTGLVPVKPLTYLKQLAQLIPNLPRRPPPVRDPLMRKWAAGADRFGTFNLLSTVSALELIEQVKPTVPSLTLPTLIIQGKLDTVVEPANAAWLYKEIGSERKALAWMPRSDHLVALDRERDDVVAMLKTFALGQVRLVGSHGTV